MFLTYSFLQKNEINVELLKDLEMGHCDDYNEEVYSQLQKFINDEEEVVIPKGTIVKLKVQPFNHHFEITLKSGAELDVVFDDDNELNEYVGFVENIGANPYFK